MHAPLFTAPVLLVEQPHRLYASEGHYEVLSEQGHPLAFVNEHMTPWRGRGGPHRPHRFTIYDPQGHPLITLDKPWERGRPYIHVSGPHGEPYGSIVQDRKFMGSRFRLNDPRGHSVAEIRGDRNGWDFAITDHAGIEIARISKEHPGLTGHFFTTDDRYALEFAYDLPWPLRRLVLAAAITVDVLLHEREPEFYHSHYADFRRYPEYGYQPRFHWHHPRRGYVVARRRRAPLVPRSRFRPTRGATRYVSSRRTGAARVDRSRRVTGPAARQESAAASGGIARRARSERRRAGSGGASARSSGAGNAVGGASSRRTTGGASRRTGGNGSSRGGSVGKSFGASARSAGKDFGASRSSGGSSRRSGGGASRGGSARKGSGASRRSSGGGSARKSLGSSRRSSSSRSGSSRRGSGGRGGSSRRSGGRSRR